MADKSSPVQSLIERLTRLFAAFPQVRALALRGSRATGATDSHSDIDYYVYYDPPLMALADRQALMAQAGGARRADLGLDNWGPGDEWFDAETGIEVDVVYFEAGWMADQINRAWVEHQPSLGYSTCFVHTVRQSQVLFDPLGWFRSLQAQAAQEYPEPLRQAIIARNHAVLRQIIPCYYFQIEKAVQRGDLVSINHRLAGLLASYFDIIFAYNRVLHPGEKRMVTYALDHCASLPVDFAEDVEAVLKAAGTPDALLPRLDALLDHLDGWL